MVKLPSSQGLEDCHDASVHLSPYSQESKCKTKAKTGRGFGGAEHPCKEHVAREGADFDQVQVHLQTLVPPEISMGRDTVCNQYHDMSLPCFSNVPLKSPS